MSISTSLKLKLAPRNASAPCFLTKSPPAQPEVTSDSFFLLRYSPVLRSATALGKVTLVVAHPKFFADPSSEPRK